ncbi:DHA2 family efflux MFS transporter permease subunit [Nocardia cyriacigeorgica]|uniref:DHA2 family efflux MFS transporter permease subunit n=1 Tax=Nocardia cyriacigeorgica TaxID=135487 RepID=UPI0024568B1D|nr:DHA2 family efflux MFS transporter permease subunit [Nocardia cyriacigeorgica]
MTSDPWTDALPDTATTPDPPPTADAAATGLSGRRRFGVLAALCLAVLVVGLDTTVLNVALPTLSVDLGASTEQLQWIANSYNLVLAVLLLPAGLLGDRFGRKKMLAIALVLFGAGSVVCALATSANQLIAARAFLGIGAALLVPVVMSLIAVLFPSEDERKKAINFFVVSNSIGLPLGPIVGGLLLDHFSWSSIFWINVPVAIIAVTAVVVLIPESRSSVRPTIDYTGILISSAALAALVYGVTLAGERGWGDAWAVALMITAAVLLGVFALVEGRFGRKGTPTPLVDLHLMRSRSFVWGTVLITVAVFAMFGLLFTMPQFFQAIQGADALGTGLKLLPFIGGMVIGAKFATPVDTAAGTRITVAIGFVILAVGLGMGTLTDAESGYGYVAMWIAIAGAGAGFAMPSAMNAALGELDPDRAGAGSSLIQAMRQVGGTVGIALLGTVVNAAYRGGVDTEGLPGELAESVRSSASGGMSVAYRLGSPELVESVTGAFVDSVAAMLWVCTAIAAVGAVAAMIFLPERSKAVDPTSLM